MFFSWSSFSMGFSSSTSIRLFINYFLFSCFCCIITYANTMKNVIYAVNCGGDAHTDVQGIHYERDPLNTRIGIASDYGKRLSIGRVHQNDHILYQTERYHTNTFGYDIPITIDGDYVLVLKFCEVYFNAPDQKVFDVMLNGEHTIISDLDIYEKVGRGVAHDEYIPFSISKGRLYYNNEDSEIRGNKIRVEFIKGFKDNPKINAMYVIKGKMEQVPRLQALDDEPEMMQSDWPKKKQQEEDNDDFVPKNRRPSGPKMPDPYTLDDSSAMLPIFIALGAFVPFLFCLCKL